MKSPMERLQLEENMLDQEHKDSHGSYMKMKTVFEKKIRLYTRFLKEDGLTDLDRLRLENKKEWMMAHLLGLIEHEDTTNKFSELTNRVHQLEKRVCRLEEYYG